MISIRTIYISLLLPNVNLSQKITILKMLDVFQSKDCFVTFKCELIAKTISKSKNILILRWKRDLIGKLEVFINLYHSLDLEAFIGSFGLWDTSGFRVSLVGRRQLQPIEFPDCSFAILWTKSRGTWARVWSKRCRWDRGRRPKKPIQWPQLYGRRCWGSVKHQRHKDRLKCRPTESEWRSRWCRLSSFDDCHWICR